MIQKIFTYQSLKTLGSCFLLMISTGLAVRGQNSFTVKGKITDTKGVTMPGVSVTVKHSQQGVVSNNEGDYVINLSKGRDTLVFSFLGFVRQQIVPGNRHTINVVLLDDKNDLNEVAVVAYGTQKKESMVSSITTINPKEIKGPTSNLTTMLAGRISGLISYQRSGEPGYDNASFFIRGITSFGSGKIDPLILIDGMESASNELARLQPDDIAAFSVLKDAAASSLYGARGANGVILITTKSGKSGNLLMTWVHLQNLAG